MAWPQRPFSCGPGRWGLGRAVKLKARPCVALLCILLCMLMLICTEL